MPEATVTAEMLDGLFRAGAMKRIGMGSRRACYSIPGTNLCVKCYRSDEEIAEGRHPERRHSKPIAASAAREIVRFRFDEKYNTCCQEYGYHRELGGRLPREIMAIFPSTMELLLLPSRGWCVVEELVSNADGSPAVKFHEAWMAADVDMRGRLLSAFEEVADTFAHYAVRIYDPQNILVQKCPDGSIRLRMTDFEPVSRTFIALDRISPVLVRMKLRRRFDRYRRIFKIWRSSLVQPADPSGRVNVLCMKWGDYYGPEYVNRLYAGVKRNLQRPFRFVCVTDDARGLADGVEAVPMPESPPGWDQYWPHVFAKLLVFKDGFAGLKGPTLFLDIDQVIMGDIGVFFDYLPGRFCMIHNWIEWRKRLFRRRPDIGNSSCFRFEAGNMNYVYEKFMREMRDAVDTRKFRTEQAFMTYAVGVKSVNWWPESWVVSFKRSCAWPFPLNLFLTPKRPAKASILCFHGHPDIPEALAGYYRSHGKPVKANLTCRPAKWIVDYWHE